jgi:hypothetical protein
MIFRDFPFRVPWNCRNIEWNIESQEALEIRKNRLKEVGFYGKLETFEDVIELSKETLNLISTSNPEVEHIVKNSDVDKINYKGRVIPLACACGNIVQREFCDNCGKSWDNVEEDPPYVPEIRLKKQRKVLKEVELIFREPLEWEKKIDNHWKQKGNRYTSKLFYPEKAVPKIQADIDNFAQRMAIYSKSFINKDDYKNKNISKRRIKRIAKEIRGFSEF